DTLQQKRDELTRAKERAELRLEVLGKEMPTAEKADAQARMAAITAEGQALAEAHTQARQRYEKALAEFIDSINGGYEPALLQVKLQSEAEYLSFAFDLPLPALPEVPQPEPQGAKDAYGRCAVWYEKLYGGFGNEWVRKLTELRQTRKRERGAAERQQR